MIRGGGAPTCGERWRGGGRGPRGPPRHWLSPPLASLLPPAPAGGRRGGDPAGLARRDPLAGNALQGVQAGGRTGGGGGGLASPRHAHHSGLHCPQVLTSGERGMLAAPASNSCLSRTQSLPLGRRMAAAPGLPPTAFRSQRHCAPLPAAPSLAQLSQQLLHVRRRCPSAPQHPPDSRALTPAASSTPGSRASAPPPPPLAAAACRRSRRHTAASRSSSRRHAGPAAEHQVADRDE